ncbi:MAG: pyridoxal 5'-phosphate synthase glutaminase subunit PdxT [Syntrophomonadaceae bacterium]|nr:pyridoxal 5'-phosphate synthase glutaminase subunit PdxT [Syntrophomonadaceae bacterium]
MAGKKIGILAMQGAFLEHQQALSRCGAEPVLVRTARDLEAVEGLIIPGGESTTIGKLMKIFGLDSLIIERVKEGMPIWGTCAGMILLAKEIADSQQPHLGLMDIKVKRNAYGRQVESFETDLEVEGIGQTRGVFIRAPYVEEVWGGTKILSTYLDKIIMVQEGNNMLATAFHPELTTELDVHKYFLAMA